jgi:uncharacterized protein YcbK (DUF882 family)
MKLTKNFYKSEFNCKCGCEMPDNILENVKELAYHLQRLRDKLNKPIKINSGYRCELHNSLIGGSKNSQHLKGLASDIVVKDYTPEQVYNFVDKLQRLNMFKLGGLGKYDTFTHLDIRNHIARW